MAVIPPAPSPLAPGRVVVPLFSVVLVVFHGPVVDVVPAQHLPAQVDEDLIYVHCMTSAMGEGPMTEASRGGHTSRAGTALVVRRLPSLRQRIGLGSLDLSLLLEVRLVTHYHDGNSLVVLDADDLLPQTGNFLQRGLGRDAKYQQEPLAAFHVQVSHGHYYGVSATYDISAREELITELLRAGRVKAAEVR